MLRPAAMKLAPEDNVAVATRPLQSGEAVVLDGIALTVDRDIAVGQKLAARAIAAGEAILKYNASIGVASHAIAAGAAVDAHNVRHDDAATPDASGSLAPPRE